jgi:transcriptional regulator with XRE-family HTH domain
MNARNFNKIVGKKVQLLREIKEMSQMDLAYELGYNSTGAISQIESGERGMGKDKLIKASKVLGVHPAILMSDKDFNKNHLKLFVDLTALIQTAPDSEHLKTIEFLIQQAVNSIEKK